MARAGKTSEHILRLGHPMAFAAFLRHNGGSCDRHFRRQGLPELCEDPNAFVPLQQAWAFFHATAESVDPRLGWHVGEFVGDHNLNGALLKKIDDARTLYQGLKRFVQMSSAEASHLQIGIQERRDDIVLFTHYPDMKGVPGYHSSQAYQIGVILGVIRHFAGKNWVPEEIGIECPTAPAIAEKLYPGSRILAHQPRGYVTIPRSVLHLAPPCRDAAKGGEDALILTERFDYPETLRALLKPHLPDGYMGASYAAALMDTSERTLARRLSEAGLTYRKVIDELRFEEARKLLETTDAPVIDVSGAVGFEDSGNFSRMFRRMAGVSPGRFRRVLRQRA